MGNKGSEEKSTSSASATRYPASANSPATAENSIPNIPSGSSSWESLSEWNEESVAQVAEWWGLDEKGVDKLWQLHDRLQDEPSCQHWKNQPNEVVRYLRDAHFHVGHAEQKFRRMVQWRIEEEIDNIIYQDRPEQQERLPQCDIMQQYIPTTVLDGCDLQGDPIWLERVGAADSWGLLKAFGHDQLIRYAVYIREACIRGEWAMDYQRKRDDGKPPMRATAIIDLEGLNMSHLKPGLLPLLKDGLHIVQYYYCGFGKKVIVIRAPSIFPMIWKVAQHFCTENLKNMMVFSGPHDYLEVLEQYVDLETLPSCIYSEGKGRGGTGMPNHLEGAKVPSKKELAKINAQQEKGQKLRKSISVAETAISEPTDLDDVSLSLSANVGAEDLSRSLNKPSLAKFLGGGYFEPTGNGEVDISWYDQRGL